MNSLSVVIPHRGSPLGLWATVTSCRLDLDSAGFDYDFIIVSNGEKLLSDARCVVHHLEKEGKLGAHHHTDEAMTAQEAREVGAKLSTKERLFFFDNHCAVEHGYFNRAMAAMNSYKISMLHSTTVYYPGSPLQYHYHLTLEKNFWGYAAMVPESSWKPYQVAAAGHGGFVIDRELFLEVGGYGKADLFRGYAGEELTFDLKLWRLGHTVWLDPKLIHHHFAGDRGYPRHNTDDFYTNMMVSAKIIGGQKWIDKVFLNFITKPTPRFGPKKPWYDLYAEADARAAHCAAELDAVSKYSLDELLQKFRREQIGT